MQNAQRKQLMKPSKRWKTSPQGRQGLVQTASTASVGPALGELLAESVAKESRTRIWFPITAILPISFPLHEDIKLPARDGVGATDLRRLCPGRNLPPSGAITGTITDYCRMWTEAPGMGQSNCGWMTDRADPRSVKVTNSSTPKAHHQRVPIGLWQS